MTKPILDLLLIDTYNTETLGIADISSYPNGFTISNPSLELTPPGYNKISVSVTPSAANFYRSSNLGMGCDNECGIALPDGIWYAKYSISPNSTRYVEKNFLRVEQLQSKKLEAFLYLDLSSDNSKLKRDLRNASLLIEGAKAASNDCNLDMAYKLYKKAEQIIDGILCLKP